MIKDKFTVKIDDKDVELLIKAPSLVDQREATKVYNQAFNEALKAKAVVRAKLNELLTEQGLWDENKERQFSNLQNNLLNGERALSKGGISLKEAKKIALSMREDRDKLRDLISVKTDLDTHTAEGQADNARFNYLVFSCTVYSNNNERYFATYEDYLNRSSSSVAVSAAQRLASMMYGLENDYEQKLPENKFLLDYKFVNKDLRLINADGKLVDQDGHLVDETGRYIDKDGNYIDRDGNRVDSKGDYIVDNFVPFTDDDGKPVVLETKEKTDEVPPVETESKTEE